MVGKDPFYIKRTKLNRPAIASEHLHRQHLLDRLEQHRHRPLSLVSAPAGYGKSVLVSCWLGSCDLPSAWVSLDKGDNDLRVFTTYFFAALETLFPGACRKSQDLLSGSDLPPVEALSSCLLNELNRIEQPYNIALDDFHFIINIEIINLLDDILTLIRI